ncbi:hypothetical protein AB0K16_19470 [Nonomuraea jabiensis]|uniref:hypothetical protein n=1 Tax=Nonomuraea jabiensis TaxID=882448 RepID=UPI00341B1B04
MSIRWIAMLGLLHHAAGSWPLVFLGRSRHRILDILPGSCPVCSEVRHYGNPIAFGVWCLAGSIGPWLSRVRIIATSSSTNVPPNAS